MSHNAYVTFTSTHYLSDNFYRTLVFLKNNGTLRPPAYSSGRFVNSVSNAAHNIPAIKEKQPSSPVPDSPCCSRLHRK